MPVTIKKNVFNYKTDNNINSIDVLANESAEQKIQAIKDYYETNVLLPSQIVENENYPLKIFVDDNSSHLSDGVDNIENAVNSYLNTHLIDYLDNKFNSLQLEETASLLIDKTLTQDSAAADAKVTGEQINFLATCLEEQLGGIKLKFSDPAEKHYIACTGTITIKTSTVDDWSYIKIECKPGDIFFIENIYGGTTAYSYAFIDENDHAINSQPATVLTNETIIAPAGAKWAVFNDKSKIAKVYKGNRTYVATEANDILASVDGLLQNGYVNTSHEWTSGKHFTLLVKPNDNITIQANDVQNTSFYVLTQYEKYNHGYPLNLGVRSTYTPFTGRISVTAKNKSTYIMPPDAKYLLFNAVSPSYPNLIPASILINGVEYTPINGQIKEIYNEIQTIHNDLDKIRGSLYSGFIISGTNPPSKWSGTNSAYKYLMFSINVGDVVKIKANSTSSAYIAILTEYIPPINGVIPSYSQYDDFQNRITISKNTSKNFIMPDDAKYLYISIHGTTADYTPIALSINDRPFDFTYLLFNVLPDLPGPGSYILKATCTNNNSSEPTSYSWVPETT